MKQYSKRANGRRSWSLWTALGATLLLGVLNGLAAADGGQGGDEEQLDVVYRTGHIAQPPITITEDNWLVVKGEKGNFKPEYLASTVEQIDYKDRSRRWMLAMVRIDQKNWSKALINFRKMFDEKDPAYAEENAQLANCKWIPHVGRYYYGLALLKNGDAALAAGEFMKAVEAREDGRYTLPALLGAADAYLQAGDSASALKTLEKFNATLDVFQKAAAAYKWPTNLVGANLACRDYADSLKMQYLYVQAKVYYTQAMVAAAKSERIPPDAESACKEYIRKANDAMEKLDRRIAALNPAQAKAESDKLVAEWKDLDAQVTQVSNFLVDIRIASKDFNGARNDCLRMIADYERTRDPRMVPRLPAAYAGLGKVAFFEADSLRQKNDSIQAQKMFAKCRWYYQHVLVLYFDNNKSLRDALYFTGLCNEYLASVNIEKDARERAYDNFKRLAEMLPESDPLYKDVAAALARTRPEGVAAPAPAPAVN